MDSKDYLFILRALTEIPFNVGKNLLIDFLTGDDSHESIVKNRLYDRDSFGSLGYSRDEVGVLVDSMIRNGFIEANAFSSNKYAKVLRITRKGLDELRKPSFFTRKLSFTNKQETSISDKDKKLFAEFGSFLDDLNDQQKKAVISSAKNLLCVAGAGSGKTRILIKRIEFLIKFKGVNPSRILAITFTRKARDEVLKRLSSQGINNARVETFNSFCEKTLIIHGSKIYERDVRVMSFKDKIIGVKRALSEQGLNLKSAIKLYFSPSQMRGKTEDQLAAIFLNDCFYVLDTFKAKGGLVDFSRSASTEFYKGARMMYETCSLLDDFMRERGLRDFADQLIDALKFFNNNGSLIPEFDHILVDEYQDVNSTQVDLINVLNPENLFCVGDPRQSIFGWRGSDVKFIMDFEKNFPGSEVIFLTKNYRSKKLIVDFMNFAIKKMGMPDLDSSTEEPGLIKLLGFKSEDEERNFVLQGILGADVPREEIFVLTRTNKSLNELSNFLKLNGVNHVVKSDEQLKKIEAKQGEVTLSTVHAVKGLEADLVFVMGCNSMNFPCKTSEHPITELVKIDNYDKEEEERRLFYVAVSRAREKLVMTYASKNPSYFVTSEMRRLVELGVPKKKEVHFKSFEKSVDNKKKLLLLEELKSWRVSKSKELGVPAFMVLHDSVLFSLVEFLPSSEQELLSIKGVGSEKVSKFGDELLGLIKIYS